MMRCTHSHLSFWAALLAALAGAMLSHGGVLSAVVPGSVWQETLRPLLIAASLLALTTAAALVYGSDGETDAGNGFPWIERPALWMAVMLSLISFLLPIR